MENSNGFGWKSTRESKRKKRTSKKTYIYRRRRRKQSRKEDSKAWLAPAIPGFLLAIAKGQQAMSPNRFALAHGIHVVQVGFEK